MSRPAVRTQKELITMEQFFFFKEYNNILKYYNIAMYYEAQLVLMGYTKWHDYTNP